MAPRSLAEPSTTSVFIGGNEVRIVVEGERRWVSYNGTVVGSVAEAAKMRTIVFSVEEDGEARHL